MRLAYWEWTNVGGDGVEVSPIQNQHFRCLHVAPVHSRVQGRPAVIVSSLHVGALRGQEDPGRVCARSEGESGEG